MKAEEIIAITAIGTVIAAVGTVGALFVSLGATKLEFKERRRGEVRGVRAWIEWRESDTSRIIRENNASLVLAGKLPLDYDKTVSPTYRVENATGEFIYDIKVAMRPIRLTGEVVAARSQLLPGEKFEQRYGLMIDERKVNFPPLGQEPGVDMVFTDGRGNRWNGSTKGQLQRKYPLRWFAPWRVPHQ